MTVYIGMDVHCKQTVFVAQSESGQVIAQGVCPTVEKSLIDAVAQNGSAGSVVIGMESGTQARFVSRALVQAGYKAFVIDAREVRAKARRRRQKTDARDAFEICDGLRRGIYASLVYIPSEAVERLRRILSRRRYFVRQRTSQIHAAKFLLRMEGLASEARSLTTERAWAALLRNESVDALALYLSRHFESWRLATAHVESLESELADALAPFGDLPLRLRTLPGVGLIGASAFIAALGDASRFETSGHVLSYLGLCSSTYDSGEREIHGKITKQGNRSARANLVECAQHASNPKHPLNPYFRRIAAKSGYKKACVAVAARMAKILFRMWIEGAEFDARRLNVVRKSQRKSRLVYWELGAAAKN
jgi:transposase